MADFESAIQKTIKNEGGYILHRVPGDTGGMTYAGISRNNWPEWEGWELIDKEQKESLRLSKMVNDFYKKNFWDPIHGDEIQDQGKAETFLDFAVNTGTRKAIKIIQRTVKVMDDGAIGPITMAAINGFPAELFHFRLFFFKMKRYAAICNSNRGQSKFLLGWTNRSLNEVEKENF